MKKGFEAKKKKGLTFALALTMALSIPFSTAFASESVSNEDVTSENVATQGVTTNGVVSPLGAGEWDYLGSSTFTTSSAIAHSSGGDFLVCLNSGPSGYYNLYEYDPNNADDRVGYVYLTPGDCGAFRSIGGFVDGDNKKAEFYVYKSFGGSATVSFYD